MTALRSILAAHPGESLDAALASAADAILLDATAGDALGSVAPSGKTLIASVSHPRTRRLREDVGAVVSPALYAILLPVFEPQDVRDAAVALREFELARDIEPGTVLVFPAIGTARALLRSADIAAATPRVGGLVFDSAAYALDVGARAEEAGARLAFARGQVVAAARAIDGLPLVAGVTLQFREAARSGFAGAIVESPATAGAANEALTPTEGDLARARAEITAYQEARAADAWVAERDGDIIDLHRVHKARRLLGEDR